MAEARPLTAAQLRARQQKRRAALRAGIQAAFFLYMPGAFTAGFTGAKHIAQWIGAGSSLQADSFVLSLLALCGCTVLFGRYFCGYVCAFGATGDLVYYLSGLVQKKLLKRKKQFSLPERAVLAAQKIKYGILLIIAALCAAGVYGSLSGWSPWDIFARLTALRAPAAGYTLGIVLLVLIAVGMALQSRFFCQFLCPLGALFALLPVLPFFALKRDGEKCIPGCRACRMNCPVTLKLNDEDGRSGECIACEKCTGICPRGNIGHMAEIKNRYIAVLMKAALFAALGFVLGLSRI